MLLLPLNYIHYLESWRSSGVVSEGYSVRSFAEIYRARLVDGNATRLLRKATAIVVAKLETDTVATNVTNYRRLLLLPLKLRGFAIESR